MISTNAPEGFCLSERFPISVLTRPYIFMIEDISFIYERVLYMSHNLDTHFFLGSNAPDGFFSLYDKFINPEKDRLNIIKGGPGCGKSTFMRSIAAAAASNKLKVEHIHCSGDPDSLDAIYIPTLRTGYVDGTAPHIMEPVYAGVTASYINLGAFYDNDSLSYKKEEIIRYNHKYKSLYTRAYRFISAGASALKAMPSAMSENTILSASRRANGIICREIKPIGKSKGRSSYRFLSALTCKGLICFFDTVAALAERVYVIDNEFGLAPIIIEAAASAALERGHNVVHCLDPMTPSIAEHIIIPSLSLAVVSSSSRFPYPDRGYRHIRLDALSARDMNKSVRNDIRNARKLSDMLFSESIKILAEAKSIHDEMESVYNPYVDFDGVHCLADEHIAALFG